MAINSLPGNFQPLTQVSGRPLPQAEKREEPTMESPDNRQTSNVSSNSNAIELANTKDNQPIDSEKLSQQVQEMNQIAQNIQRRLAFEIDDVLGKPVVSVFDKETDELIRQIPPEDLLVLSKRLKELNEQSSEARSPGIFIQHEV